MGDKEHCKSSQVTAKQSSLLTAAAICATCLLFSLIPGPGDAWVVPENLPHQGGYAASTPGLRPVSGLEWYFLSGSPFFQFAYWGLVFSSVISWRRQRRALFASTATALVLLSFLWALEAPTVRHRCMSPNGLCAANLKNLGSAMELFKEENGSYPQQVSALTPDHVWILPTCPLIGESYEVESSIEGYVIRCRPHPRYYSGNDCTSFGKNYLSLQPGGEVLSYSSEEGMLGLPEHQ